MARGQKDPFFIFAFMTVRTDLNADMEQQNDGLQAEAVSSA